MTVQASDNGGTDQGGGGGDGEKSVDSECVLKVESGEFAGGLDVVGGGERGRVKVISGPVFA